MSLNIKIHVKYYRHNFKILIKIPRIDEKDGYPNVQQIHEKVVMSPVTRQMK